MWTTSWRIVGVFQYLIQWCFRNFRERRGPFRLTVSLYFFLYFPCLFLPPLLRVVSPMEVENLNNGEISKISKPDLQAAGNEEPPSSSSIPRFVDEIDSSCSTPYVSAPSSPGRGLSTGFFFSAPASPMHYVLSSAAASSEFISSSSDISVDFEFSARFNHNSSTAVGSMISADELFYNGQIRPMKLSSHLQRPQILAPLLDLEGEGEDEDEDDEETVRGGQKQEKMEAAIVRGRDLRLRNRSLHRRTRSMSPLRNRRDEGEHERNVTSLDPEGSGPKETEPPSDSTTPSVSASSSRSSSTSSRSSKRWIFLMDFLHRSKSEGRGSNKEKFWSSISFSASLKEKKTVYVSRPSSPSRKPKRAVNAPPPAKKTTGSGAKPVNAVGKRRNPPSPHELLYTANRAQAEEMKKKTFLPYRQGLLGCLGYSSKSYGAMNRLARTLNPVSSR